MAVSLSGSGKTVVLASADAALRQRLRLSLTGMRWTVREASGGAEAMAALEEGKPEALLMDYWLPDLEVGEFAGQIQLMYPGVDLLRVDGDPVEGAARSPRGMNCSMRCGRRWRMHRRWQRRLGQMARRGRRPLWRFRRVA